MPEYPAGDTVYYAFQVLNAQPGVDGSMDVEVQAALYRAQTLLGSGKPVVVNGKNQPDPKRLVMMDDFRLGKQLPPGDYTLRITAVDNNAGAKRGTAAQAMDFEVGE